jgi:Cu2+-exporting ATPase
LYANDEAKRAAFLLLAVAASEQPSGDVAVCGENLPEPAGRPSWGPFLRYIFVRPFMPVLVRVATAVAASVPFILKGVAALCRGRLSVDVLDAAAIGISLLRRDFKTARLLTLLLGFGEALEAWTRKKSLDTLAQSLALDVDTVWVRREGREMHVAISELSEDDLVIVRTGSAIPVDGVVAEGEASVNQASMTGEPLGVLRSPGSSVYAGTVVEEGEIAIRPTGVGDGTRLRQIVRFIEDSEALKAGVQGKAERLADAVVPFSFLLAGLVWLVTRNPARAASVLLVDYSCALKLSTPLAVLAAMKEEKHYSFNFEKLQPEYIPTVGDVVIVWDDNSKENAVVGVMNEMDKTVRPYKINDGTWYGNCDKFVSEEQYKNLIDGKE